MHPNIRVEETMNTKSIDTWLDEYAESHQNKTNKAIHWVCVPLIFLTIMALIWAIPVPSFMASIPFLNWATISTAVIILFYSRLSISLMLGMLMFTIICLGAIYGFEQAFPGKLVPTAVIAFIILWVGQFYGHKIEGKKPSFLKDVQFLMIGPAWVMAFIYRKLGLKY